MLIHNCPSLLVDKTCAERSRRHGCLSNISSPWNQQDIPLIYAPCDIFTAQSPLAHIPIKGQYPSSQRSRSVWFWQTWHTHPHQRPLKGRSPFQVCAFPTNLAHPSPSEATPRQATVPGLHIYDRPGTPIPLYCYSMVVFLFWKLLTDWCTPGIKQ